MKASIVGRIVCVLIISPIALSMLMLGLWITEVLGLLGTLVYVLYLFAGTTVFKELTWDPLT